MSVPPEIIHTAAYDGPDRRRLKWHQHEHVSWGVIVAILIQAGTGLWWLKGLSDDVRHLTNATSQRFATVESTVTEHRTNGVTMHTLEALLKARDVQLRHHEMAIGEIKGTLRDIKAGVDKVSNLLAKHDADRELSK